MIIIINVFLILSLTHSYFYVASLFQSCLGTVILDNNCILCSCLFCKYLEGLKDVIHLYSVHITPYCSNHFPKITLSTCTTKWKYIFSYWVLKDGGVPCGHKHSLISMIYFLFCLLLFSPAFRWSMVVNNRVYFWFSLPDQQRDTFLDFWKSYISPGQFAYYIFILMFLPDFLTQKLTFTKILFEINKFLNDIF